jgi:hypothetical protein
VQVGGVAVQELAAAVADFGQQLLDAAGAGKAADRLLGQAKLAHDRLDALALGAECLDGGVAFPGAHHQGALLELLGAHRGKGDLLRSTSALRTLGVGLLVPVVGAVVGAGTEAAAVAGDRRLDMPRKVVPQVPAVGDLQRGRRAPAGRRRRRRQRGRGRRPWCRGARPARRRRWRPPGRRATRPGGGWPRPPARCRSGGRGAGRSRPRQAPRPARPWGRAGHGPGAAASSGWRGAPAPRPAAPRRGPPAPARPAPAGAVPAGCGAHAAWSGRATARRRCVPGRRDGGRRTGGPAAGPALAGRRWPRRPGCARSGCAPSMRGGRTGGSWRVGLVGRPRPARRHRPARRARWLRPPGAEGGRRGLGVHMPRMVACPAIDLGSVRSRKVGQIHFSLTFPPLRGHSHISRRRDPTLTHIRRSRLPRSVRLPRRAAARAHPRRGRLFATARSAASRRPRLPAPGPRPVPAGCQASTSR